MQTSTTSGFTVWILVTASIGITASVIWCINALIINGNRLFKIVLPFSILYLVALVYTVMFIDFQFKIIIMFYLPPMVVFAFVSGIFYLKYRIRAWVYLFTGLILSFIAAAIQYFQIGIHPIYFNHNALYHVIQGIALVMIFIASRLLLKQTTLK